MNSLLIKLPVMISQMAWEPLGVLFFAGAAYALWRQRKKIDWLYCSVVAGLFFAVIWRLWIGATVTRYYNILLFPVLFCSFYLIWYGPWPRVIAQCLLAAAAIICIGKDIRSNPYDDKVLAIYRKIYDQTRGNDRVLGLSFTKLGQREQYYTQINVCRPDRETTLANHIDGLRNNFSVFDGDYNAVYLFIESAPNQPDVLKSIDAPDGRVELVGETYLSRNQKKKLTVLRYLPAAAAIASTEPGELLPNGDFSAVLPDDKASREIARLKVKSPRFATEKARLPANWYLYQSLTIKTTSFASVIDVGGHHAMLLDAKNSYLVLISPPFAVDIRRTVSFALTARRDSILQLSRSVTPAQGKSELYPVTMWKVAAGAARRYEINLEPRPGAKNGSLWFWLHSGEIVLSDVRIK